MEKKKLSSVEWLGLELNIIFHDITPELWEQVEVKFQQAKAMHKVEVINGYAVGHNDGCAYMHDGKPEFKNPEQYYNETFGETKN
mgnify:CR=1 FL=1